MAQFAYGLLLVSQLAMQTAQFLSLAEVKQHLRVEHDDEDVLIAGYMDTAPRALLNFCGLSIVPHGAEPVFKIAGFLMIAELYDDRDGSGEDGMPNSARRLVWPYKLLSV